MSEPKECGSYKGNIEYECINNYKPLDENYKWVFRGHAINVKRCLYIMWIKLLLS